MDYLQIQDQEVTLISTTGDCCDAFDRQFECQVSCSERIWWSLCSDALGQRLIKLQKRRDRRGAEVRIYEMLTNDLGPLRF
jgi:hypothetical protein